jgi:hypothetical protein
MPKLFSEFDMSPYIKGVSTTTPWYLLMHLRLAWNEVYRDERLADWGNKKSMKALCQHHGIATAEVYHQFQPEVFSEAALREVCETLMAADTHFVIKPYHLTGGQGVFVYQQGHFETAKAVNVSASKVSTRAMRLGIKSLAHRYQTILEQRASAREAWSQRQSQSGLLIEAMIDAETEIRVMTIWGEVIGASLSNAQVFIDAEGRIFGDDAESWHWLSALWPRLVKTSERLAGGTDMLRIDIFANQTAELWVNDIRTFVWPLASTFSPFLSSMSEIFVSSYQDKSVRLVDRTFARLH